MGLNPLSGSSTVLVERYCLVERLSGPDPVRGSLWRATDVMAGDLPVAMRQLELPAAKARFKSVWPQLQSLLHPQLPRYREMLKLDGDLWLLHDWQDGVAYDVLLREKRFEAAEVLTLLLQILPALEVMHGSGLVHGDVNPRHLLRRSSDGLPVLLDGGRLQPQGSFEQADCWRDLQDLGRTALTLLTGSASHDRSWPEGLELEAKFRQALELLLSDQPKHSFAQAAEVLKALESIVLPASKADPELYVTSRIRRARDREQSSEGRLWPVVIALAFAALVGTSIAWFLLKRVSPENIAFDRLGRQPVVSTPSAELDQGQQLFSRLKALQVDRGWFLKLVDASQLSSESLEAEPLQGGLTDLEAEWLARIEQLPPAIRSRLGSLRSGDWEQQRQVLVQQEIHQKLVEYLVSAGSQSLLPGSLQGRRPAEPFLQLWIAAAMQILDDIEIVHLKTRALEPINTSVRVPAGGMRLVLVEVLESDVLALSIKGSPLMQMMVFDANGQVEEPGPLRAVRISAEAGSPLQVLVTNEGISSDFLTLSCKID